jgi:hypothetical protein
MTDFTVPTDTPLHQPATPITVSHGRATVAYHPGARVEMAVIVDDELILTGVGPANDLRVCLDKLNRALNPLAESQRVARRVAALAVPA